METGKTYEVKTTQWRRHHFRGVFERFTYDIHGNVEGYVFRLVYGEVYITKSTIKSAILGKEAN